MTKKTNEEIPFFEGIKHLDEILKDANEPISGNTPMGLNPVPSKKNLMGALSIAIVGLIFFWIILWSTSL